MEELPLISTRTLYSVIGDWPSYLAAAFAVFGWAFGIWKGLRRI